MEKPTLKAEVRKIIGRKVKTLRNEGLLPANIFGKKIKSEAVQIKLEDFIKVYKKVGETGLLSLVVGKAEKPVLIANVQKDPVSDVYLHVDLHQVDLKEKVEAEVVVEIVGESPVEKQGLGTVVQYINEVKVESLPADLPEKFEVDATKLTEVEQTIFAKDLKFDKVKVELKIDPETIIVKVEPPQKEEVVTPPPAAEVPAEGETVPTEETLVESGEQPKAEEKKVPEEKPQK